MAEKFVASYVTKAGQTVTVVSKSGTPEAVCAGCDVMYLSRSGSEQSAKDWASDHAAHCVAS